MLSYSAKIFLFSLIFLANANHSFAHASKNIFKTIKHNPNATKVHGSGLIKLVFVDAAIDDVAEPIIYKLESKGTIKPVQFKSGLKKPQENTFIKYSGYELNNKVYINDYKTDNKKFAILEESTVNDVTGTHKLLVVKVSDGTKDSPTYGYSDNELREFYSTGSNNMVDFYKEASSNNLNLEVEYYDPILTVNNLCLASEDSPMDNDEYLNAITRLEEDYGSLADVSFVSFVVPDNQTCLASGLLGVATLGKESFTLSNGNKLLSANFINSDHVNVSSENEYGLDIRYAVFHELGHNLGMHHDNAHVCGEEILSSPCYSLEYGGSHSIMGFSPSYAHPNTTYKEKMGWLSSSEIQSLSGTSFVEEVDLYPVSSGGTGTKLIKVDRGDGIFYNMEYREAVGYDGKILPTRTYNNGGFLVYYEDPSITNTILMDSKFKDRRRYMDFLLGDRYIDNLEAIDFNSIALFKNFEDTTNQIFAYGQNLGTDIAKLTIIKNPDGLSNFFESIKHLFNISVSGTGDNEEIIPFKDHYLYLHFNGRQISYNSYLGERIKEVQWDLDQDGTFETITTRLNYSVETSFTGLDGEELQVKVIEEDGQETILNFDDLNIQSHPLTGDIELRYLAKRYPYESVTESAVPAFNSIRIDFRYENSNKYFPENFDVEWDLDGDDIFERQTSKPVTNITFSETKTITPKIRFTNPNSGAKDTRTMNPITIAENLIAVNHIKVDGSTASNLNFALNESKSTKIEVNFDVLDTSLFEGKRDSFRIRAGFNDTGSFSSGKISKKIGTYEKLFKTKIKRDGSSLNLRMTVPSKSKLTKISQKSSRPTNIQDMDFLIDFGRKKKKYFTPNGIEIPFAFE